MYEIRSEEGKNREINRVLALIISGIYVLIILPIIAVIISLFLDSLVGFLKIIPYPINIVIAIIFFINGFFWAIWSNFELYRSGKGSPVPLKRTQTTALVSKGPYKYTRNPMIFGYISIWIGLGCLLNSIFLLLGFTLGITIFLLVIVKL